MASWRETSWVDPRGGSSTHHSTMSNEQSAISGAALRSGEGSGEGGGGGGEGASGHCTASAPTVGIVRSKPPKGWTVEM